RRQRIRARGAKRSLVPAVATISPFAHDHLLPAQGLHTVDVRGIRCSVPAQSPRYIRIVLFKFCLFGRRYIQTQSLSYAVLGRHSRLRLPWYNRLREAWRAQHFQISTPTPPSQSPRSQISTPTPRSLPATSQISTPAPLSLPGRSKEVSVAPLAGRS